MASEELLGQYDEVRGVLAERGDAIAGEVERLLATEPAIKIQAVTWRLKDRASLARKLARPDRIYGDLWMLTDLVGVRVITYFADGVEQVGELLERHFAVDFGHSIDKRRRETTELGYRSLHYVARLGPPLPERASFEVQVRTVLEHAWAEIEHDLGYKAAEEIPVAFRRRLARLAGLLELADQEFGAIRADLEAYARALPARIAAAEAPVLLDRLSLAALLERPEVRAVDEAVAATLGAPLGAEAFFPDYLLRMLAASGLRTADEAREGLTTQAARIGAMVGPYFAIAERLWQLSPARMALVPRGYGLFFLAHTRVLEASSLRLERVERLARLYRELDYPDDPRTAHDVATLLVDAFERG